ncbi:hypothetical protein BT69DRAFT_1289283 [Atractiella rhizophila]|nr:hypothetical protein BT69DRAFT_1289283 [Atractiella rhizophila]
MLLSLVMHRKEGEPFGFTAHAVASTAVQNQMFAEGKRVYISKKEAVVIDQQPKSVFDISDKETFVLEIIVSFCSKRKVRMYIGMREIEFSQDSQSDLEELSFSNNIDLGGTFVEFISQSLMHLSEFSMTRFNLQFEFVQPWRLDPFSQLPSELVDCCLTKLLEEAVNLEIIQRFRIQGRW